MEKESRLLQKLYSPDRFSFSKKKGPNENSDLFLWMLIELHHAGHTAAHSTWGWHRRFVFFDVDNCRLSSQ